MTTLKIDSTPGAAALAALEPHVPGIYRDPARRTLALVELVHVERVQPGPDTEKAPSVKVRVGMCEVPSPAQEDTIRDAMRALYVQRTAFGTINEQDELELSRSTLAKVGQNLEFVESARLAAGVRVWEAYTAEVLGKAKTLVEFQQELRVIRDGLRKLGRPGVMETTIPDGVGE